MEVTETNPKL